MNILYAKSKYFDEGVNLYNKEKFKEAQFKFEQEIVFNPKVTKSYHIYICQKFSIS